jgi:tellurite resistance protein
MKAVVIACVLWLLPPAALAQSIGRMADDAQKTLNIHRCKAAFHVDEQAAKKAFQAILSVMLDRHGEAGTDAAMNAALVRLVDDAKAKGMDEWCQHLGMWMLINFPEVVGK